MYTVRSDPKSICMYIIVNMVTITHCNTPDLCHVVNIYIYI